MSGAPKGIVLLADEGFLELFTYMQFDKGNAALLDVDNPESNLARKFSVDEDTPLVHRHLNSFDEFRRTFIDPIQETCGSQSLGLAFRGQTAERPLHSGLKRFWDRIPEPPTVGGIPHGPRWEGVYRSRDVNAVVSKYLFQDGQVLLPDEDHLHAILQHYGAPTRLLDWTLDLDIALFFAFEHAPQTGSDRVAIYMADIGKLHMINWRAVHGAEIVPDIPGLRRLNPRRFDETWVFLRPSSFGDIRMSVQCGVFSRQQYETQYEMTSMQDFLSISREEWNDNRAPKYACRENREWKQQCREWCRYPGTLWIVTLPVTERPTVRQYLSERGVTRERLFVSWEQICRELISQCTDKLLSGDPFPWHYLTPEQVDEIASRSSARPRDRAEQGCDANPGTSAANASSNEEEPEQ